MSQRTENDNNGTWFMCISSKRAKAIEPKLRGKDCPQLIKNTVGSLEDHSPGWLYVQINTEGQNIRLWQVAAALSDLGVDVLYPVHRERENNGQEEGQSDQEAGSPALTQETARRSP